MDIHNLKSCVSHDEAMIGSFSRDPDFAAYYLNAVLADGDDDEIRDTQAWFDEAKSRSTNSNYWNAILGHAQETANSGQNIANVVALVSQALDILKSAVHANA